jgi:hypothetical protein
MSRSGVEQAAQAAQAHAEARAKKERDTMQLNSGYLLFYK